MTKALVEIIIIQNSRLKRRLLLSFQQKVMRWALNLYNGLSQGGAHKRGNKKYMYNKSIYIFN